MRRNIREPPPSARPAYNDAYDTADEWAVKFGGQYRFEFGLTVSYLWEEMHRNVPAVMEFQNERQRTGDWLPSSTSSTAARTGSQQAGRMPVPRWATRVDSTTTTPDGIGNNQANMYTFAWWHKLDKQLTWYFDFAETVNDGQRALRYRRRRPWHQDRLPRCHARDVHRLQQCRPDDLGRLPSRWRLDGYQLQVLTCSTATIRHDWIGPLMVAAPGAGRSGGPVAAWK